MDRVQKSCSYFMGRRVSKPNCLESGQEEWMWQEPALFCSESSKNELSYGFRGISRNCANLRPHPGDVGYSAAETWPGFGGEHCEVEEWGPELWGSRAG